MPKPIPTNIVTGFLGTGKTTAILNILQRKPAAEKWAVLVNEFGEIGIDGAILKSSGAEIREVAGGCMCCVAGLPMKVALNTLITKVQPDRLLIEPSGLGHPHEIIETLRGEYYDDVLDLRAVICLLDPRRLSDARYREHAIFNDQLRVADILVANKTDLCGPAERQLFEECIAAQQPAKSATGWVERGQLDLAWFDYPTAFASDPHAARIKNSQPTGAISGGLLSAAMPLPIVLLPGTPFARREHRGADFSSCGWRFAANTRFDFQRLLGLLSGVPVRRLKGVMHTECGNFIFNADDGVLSINEINGDIDSVIECIDDGEPEWSGIERELLAARRQGGQDS